MKFARLGPLGHEIPALLHDGKFFDLRSETSDIDGGFLERFDPASLLRAFEAGSFAELADAESMRVGSPIARPSAIYCVGMNYAAHARESGSEPPANLVMFMKPPNTVVGPFDEVEIPKGSTKTDWEVELGIVIGKRASYLDSTADSAQHIAGFVLANDLSERTFQLEVSGGQWSKGKASPGFTPVGPWLVTPDEINADALQLRSFVNGETRQNSTTADLIFNIDYIVWHLSQFLALEPGDLILTGTPEGVALSGRFPYLTDGDVVEVEIEGLGRARQVMRAFAGASR